jgi:hypothetical protein
LTPDDIGFEDYFNTECTLCGKTGTSTLDYYDNVLKCGSCDIVIDDSPMKSRARQNVVFEMGFFIGLLGRKRVCILSKTVEIPTDIQGMIYVEYKQNVKEKTDKIRQELISAGYNHRQ